MGRIVVRRHGNTLFVWTTRTDETGNKPLVVYARWYNIATGLKAEVKLDDSALKATRS